jgi:hypothetical protein
VLRQVRVDQDADQLGPGNELVQLAETLGSHIDRGEGHAGDVAARPIEIGNQARSNRIVADYEDDRCRARCRLGGLRRSAVADDHRHPTPHQVCRQLRQPILLPVRPAVLHRDILAIDEARLLQALLKRCH